MGQDISVAAIKDDPDLTPDEKKVLLDYYNSIYEHMWDIR